MSSTLSVRERLAEHPCRMSPVRVVITLMDPVGFALENFDAVGRWRTRRRGKPTRRDRRPSRRQHVFGGVAGPSMRLLNRPGPVRQHDDGESS